MSSLGTKIKKVRELKNITQQHVADQLGMAQSAYSRMENDSLGIDDQLLNEIAKILEVDKEIIENFDERVVLNNPTINDNGTGVHFCNHVSYYAIDPKLEALYEKQIKLLEEQIELLTKQVKG